jgi:phosphohistidine swiveling domain-containing protein
MEFRDKHTYTILSADQVHGTSNGGKAAGLNYLSSRGFNVPDYYVLDDELLSAISTDGSLLERVIAEWVNEQHIASDSRWAVRSSAEVEDGAVKSFAGLFRTELNVAANQLHAAILNVYDGFVSADKSYTGESEFRFNIILQQMISPEYSGVAFSLHPITGNEAVVFANMIPGIGTTLVSGDETALTIEMRNGLIQFGDELPEFHGITFERGSEPQITRSLEAMKRDIRAVLPELERGVRKLQREKKQHVDVEFAIAQEKIWWLQVRPVTAITGPVRIWDNSNIGENYPGITMPLTISLAKLAYGNSYGAMGSFLGAGKKFADRNRELLFNMVGGINGALYYHVTAWQQLLYQAPFGKRTSKLITRMWGANEASFEPPKYTPSVISYLRLTWNFLWSFVLFGYHRKKYLRTYPTIVTDYTKGQLRGKSHAELVDIYHAADRKFAANWAVPMLNGFYTLIVFSLLKKSVSNSRLAEKYPNFVNDVLFSSNEVISVSIVRELQTLLQSLRSDAKVLELFSTKEVADISSLLPSTSLSVNSQIRAYIEKYGERGEEGELRMEAVNYKEDPLRFISMLKSNLGSDVPVSRPTTHFDYKQALNEAYGWRFVRKLWLRLLINITVKRVTDRENFRFMRTRFFSMIRCIFREMDHVLLANGSIASSGDSLFLEADEILQTERASEYRDIIAKRKSEYQTYSTEEHYQRYEQRGNVFVPAVPIEVNASAMKGAGCCSGIVTGEVRIIDASMIHDASLTGKILVARNFEPGWIGLFGKAKGLVAERGSLLSHTAILCRELGIPSIVGAAGVTKKLNDGDIVRMNGATGEIVKQEND